MIRINKKSILISLSSALGGIVLFIGIVASMNRFNSEETKTNIIKVSDYLNLQKKEGYENHEIELIKRITECSKQYGVLTGEGYFINLVNLNECTELPDSFTGINVTIKKNDLLFLQITETDEEQYIAVFDSIANRVIASISLKNGKPKLISYDVYNDYGELIKTTIDNNWDGQSDLKINYGENSYSQTFRDGTWHNVKKKGR